MPVTGASLIGDYLLRASQRIARNGPVSWRDVVVNGRPGIVLVQDGRTIAAIDVVVAAAQPHAERRPEVLLRPWRLVCALARIAG